LSRRRSSGVSPLGNGRASATVEATDELEIFALADGDVTP